jgi:hypothetical protein
MNRFSRDPIADQIARRALATAAAFHDELQQALASRLDQLDPSAPLSDVLDAVQHVMAEYADPLAQILTDAQLAAWLVGAESLVESLPPSRLPLDVQAPAPWSWEGSPAWLPLVKRAVKDLQERDAVTRPQWDALSGELRQRAFTVAGYTTQAAVGKIRDALVETTARGETFPEFRKTVEEAVGTSPVGPGHLENVFRTGTGKALADAQHEIGQSPVVVDLFPYRERLPIADSRLTELCATLARSGIQHTAIYRAVDPVWIRTRPLSHFQCRCGTRLLSREDAAERGIVSARRWLETGVDPQDFVPEPDVQMPPGWRP